MMVSFAGGMKGGTVKRIAIVLLCILLALMVNLLVEDFAPSADKTKIVGYESDSLGGRYIYLDNGEIYHRRAQADSKRAAARAGLSSPDDQGYIRNWGIRGLNQEEPGGPGNHGPRAFDSHGS